MRGLTGRQEQTLDYIRQSIQARGYPPTLREIGEYMGIRSTNGVNDHLRALERKGYLRREDMKSRALRVVDPPVRQVTPQHAWTPPKPQARTGYSGGRLWRRSCSSAGLDVCTVGVEAETVRIGSAPWSSERILGLRNKIGLTQEQFARRLGVTYVTVNRWENGKVLPKGLSLRALEDLEALS